MKQLRIGSLAGAALLLAISSANADSFDLSASIDGAQAGTDSGGSGSATMTYDDVSNLFSWDIQWVLDGAISVAHFHGPAEPGQTAGVEVNFGSISGLVSPSVGSATLDEAQEADLLAGLWYINIHSDIEPGGEVRGQVVIAVADTDADGVDDTVDNCTEVANADQRDTNGDGFGNACDADLNGDLTINFEDLQLFKAVIFMSDEDADFDGNGTVDFQDLTLMKASFFGAPGPAAEPPSAPTYNDDVQPIFEAKCAPCHTIFGSGGHNIGTSYTDSLLPSNACPGETIGGCALIRVQDGSMPQGAGCTGDPAQDAGNAACLTQEEQDTVQAWLDAGQPE